MKNVMKRAWKIAKQGAKKFGGKAIDYIAEALKMAWKEVKQMSVRIVAEYGRGRNYVAKIVGAHPKWKLNREFLTANETHRSYSGKTGWDAFLIEDDGIYEKQSLGRREYFLVENGEVTEIEYDEVLTLVK